MLKSLFQLLIFVLFLIGNGYQSVITNFMMNPMEISLFKNLDELLSSNYEVIVSSTFHYFMQYNPLYQKAIEEDRIQVGTHRNRTQNFAFNIPCIYEKMTLKYSKEGQNMYSIRYTVGTQYKQLDIGVLNCFADHLQRLLDLSHDHGLIQAWMRIYSQKLDDIISQTARAKEKAIKSNLLDLSQIFPICVILFIGNSVAILVFLFEIFYNDFLSQLGYIWRKWWWKWRELRRKRRIIVVKPVN